MNIPKSELRIETMRGTGKGGQHRNKTDSACRITHIPTGISAYADERSQKHSKKLAMAELRRRLNNQVSEARASEKKAKRDHAIHNTPIIRTYHFPRNTVKDHRTGKSASIDQVLRKGRFNLIAPKDSQCNEQ